MGQCMSSSTTAAARTSTTTRASPPSKDTALVLMPSGEMREYPRPTPTSRVLDDASTTTSSPNSSDWFLCDADVLGFDDGPIPSLLATDPLRAGQIYFILPAAARRKGLTREEVAALAVKASHALSSRAAASATASSASTAQGKKRRGAVVAPLVFAPPEEEQEERRVEEALKKAKAPPVRRQAPRVRSGKRLERFASDLDAIPECERDD